MIHHQGLNGLLPTEFETGLCVLQQLDHDKEI